jgi:hypothetical protein
MIFASAGIWTLIASLRLNCRMPMPSDPAGSLGEIDDERAHCPSEVRF